MLKRLLGWAVAAVAIVVMVAGLLPGSADADPDTRQQQLAQRLACPWCDGQSLAESDSEVASDLVVILREKIDAGWDDERIYEFFASKYGDQIVLDPAATGWGIVLWSLPAAALVVGGWIVWSRQRVLS